MNFKPLISIIIPTYNRGYCVGNAIKSAINQTYKNLEIIVIDDGSNDNTNEVVESFKDNRIKFYKHKINKGTLAAKNTGFDIAKGDFIGVLDSDDELFPDAIETLVKILKDFNGDIGTVLCNCVNSIDGSFTGKGVTESGFLNYCDYLGGKISGDFWGLVSRDVLGNNRFNEELRRGFERILWLKLWKKAKVYYIHKCLKLNRIGEKDH